MKTYETQEFLKDCYEKSGFFATYSAIYQVFYSQAQSCFYALPYRKKAPEAVGFFKRGRCGIITAEQAQTI